jgi:AhpD family alkylhydroperoxidase
MDYQETRNDMLQTFGRVPGFFDQVSQDMLVQMWPAMKAFFLGQTRIPGKYRELVSLGVAIALKCPQCETFHKAAAKMNGASEDELSEVGSIVGQVTLWSSVLHTMNYDMATFLREFQAMGEGFSKRYGENSSGR